LIRAFLGLGTNLGDLAANLEFGRQGLEAARVHIVAASDEERTAPVGGVGQPDFLNQALAVDTDLEPLRLLTLAKEIEQSAGRESGVRWGPRILDIDILLYGDQVIDSPLLVVPHAELPRRAFVLRELLQLNPDLIDPRSGVALREMLAAL
jgi:2-amino-4-hydroxy-6-hydroxymethyldihydropteridine diphosphokinase